jgi:hypothetical protein
MGDPPVQAAWKSFDVDRNGTEDAYIETKA